MDATMFGDSLRLIVLKSYTALTARPLAQEDVLLFSFLFLIVEVVEVLTSEWMCSQRT